MSTHRLDLVVPGLDDFSFNPRVGGGSQPYQIEVAAEGVDFGSPEAGLVVANGLLRDGEKTRVDRFGNRVQSFRVRISGGSSYAVARGEEALQARCLRRAQLIYTPPDGGPATVFEIQTSFLKFESSDMGEVRLRRVFWLTLVASPFPHARDLVTETFTTGTAGLTALSSGTVTDWTSNQAITSTTYQSETVVELPTTGGAPTLTWGGTNPVGFMYLEVAVTPTSWGVLNAVRTARGGYPVASQVVNAYFRRLFFAAEDNPTFEFDGNQQGAVPTYYVNTFGQTSAIPADGVLVLPVTGSMRTSATIIVSRGGGSLGSTFVYADPTLLTHGWVPDDGSTWARAPGGAYAVWGRDFGSMPEGTQITVTVPGHDPIRCRKEGPVGSYSIPLGVIHLGERRDGSSGIDVTGFTLTEDDTGATWTTADLILLRQHEDATTLYVRDVAYPDLVIETPSVDREYGGIWAGDDLDNDYEVESVMADTDSWAYPSLVTPLTAFWVDSSNAPTPVVTASYYPAFFSFSPI